MTHRPRALLTRSIHSLASRQDGYFTARQATVLGYGYRKLAGHIKAGDIERTERGLYRVVAVPICHDDDLVRVSFWSHDRSGKPQAVVSHVTALLVHRLSDLLPRMIHVTVPPGFRRSAPRCTVLHRHRLEVSEVEERDTFRVTTLLRTLRDCANAPDVPQDELTKAARDALESGLVHRDALAAADQSAYASARLLRALADAPGAFL